MMKVSLNQETYSQLNLAFSLKHFSASSKGDYFELVLKKKIINPLEHFFSFITKRDHET